MRTGLSEVNSLVDPLQSWNFDLLIPNVPGGGDGRQLMIKTMSTSIPGVKLDIVPVALHGVEVNYAGREVFNKVLNVVYLETRDTTTRTALLNWVELARNMRLNEGSFKSEYATTADLILYDDTGGIVRTIRLTGLWPTDLNDSALDGSVSNAVNITIDFSYDTFEDLV